MILPAHGANFAALYAAFNVEIPHDRAILDFSTNTNVVRWDGKLDLDVAALASNYPDPENAALRRAIAEREHCSTDNVLVTNGSNEALYLIASCFGGLRAFIPDPVYGEYRAACRAFGVLETERAECADIRFLCNPCNPTGQYVKNAEVEATARANDAQIFVVDEAYRDFLRGTDRPIALQHLPNILILRSLTKIFHLCGARIGYVLADGEWIRRLSERQPTWSVNAFAQEACLRFLADTDFVDRTRAYYAAETPRFIANLTNARLRASQTEANFFLIEVADDKRAIRALLKQGIVVRHTRNFKGLDGRAIRVATKLPEENDRFIDAVRRLKFLRSA